MPPECLVPGAVRLADGSSLRRQGLAGTGCTTPSSKSWYALKSKAAPSRYGLSKNIQTLLQGLDEYYSGNIDAPELGRMVRLSPQRRASIANTITKCANIIKREPSEVKTCVDIIEMCTEILEIADNRPPVQVFPFMRLPVEIRDNILDRIISNVFRSDHVVPARHMTRCGCPKIDRGLPFQSAQMKALPTLLGTALKEEYYRIFYRKMTFRFRCACELRVHLSRSVFVDNVRHVAVHWCGVDSDKAFQMLAKCPRLETLAISISKSTNTYLSDQARFMRDFFPIYFRNVRFSDVLGLNELLAIRGLKSVRVSHVPQRGLTSFAVEMERAGLSNLLTNRLTLPAADDEFSTQDEAGGEL